MFTCRIDDDLELRLPEERDADAMFALTDDNREYLRSWLPWVDATKAVDATLAFIKNVRKEYAEGSNVPNFMWYKKKLVGSISLFGINPHGCAEIGYWVAEKSQGKGIITRSCKALMQHGFETLKLNRIQIRCAVDNKKSRSVIDKLGFKEIGIHRQSEKHTDGYKDIFNFDLLADEWREMKGKQ